MLNECQNCDSQVIKAFTPEEQESDVAKTQCTIYSDDLHESTVGTRKLRMPSLVSMSTRLRSKHLLKTHIFCNAESLVKLRGTPASIAVDFGIEVTVPPPRDGELMAMHPHTLSLATVLRSVLAVLALEFEEAAAKKSPRRRRRSGWRSPINPIITCLASVKPSKIAELMAGDYGDGITRQHVRCHIHFRDPKVAVATMQCLQLNGRQGAGAGAFRPRTVLCHAHLLCCHPCRRMLAELDAFVCVDCRFI